MKKNILYGVAGVMGTTITAWRLMFPWIGDDLKIRTKTNAIIKSQILDSERSDFLIDKFEASSKKYPDKVFIIYEDNLYTYRMIDELANKVANVARSQWGLSVGGTVALYCTNSPQFVWTFLGLCKLGVTVAMINTSLRAKAFTHSVISSGATIIIVGEDEELVNSVIDAANDLTNIKIYIQGNVESQIPPQFSSFDELMLRALPVPIDKSIRSEVDLFSTCCFIYTSGTTGLPKPTYIEQYRAISLSTAFYHVLSLTPNDVLYGVLPLFHSAASMGLWSCINVGATIVLKKKFSATDFWQDVKRYNVTVFQYIGELCRYLLARPPSPLDTQHKVRAIIGNGLRKDIWMKFQTRFKIPLIVEFFGATDGNTFLFQMSNKPGACGRMSPFTRMVELLPRRLVKYDYDTAEPLRDKNGRCIEIKPGETGIILGAINPLTKHLPIYRASADASNKKIIRNAFVDGDEYFNFGDLLYLDKDYFVYFNDRIGDTFRWKGENVSTTEVANVLTGVECIYDANVYGVTVPEQDGRVGMAAITLNNDKNITRDQLQDIYNHCEKELPSYAVPMFLRVLEEAILTETFKHKKRDIIQEGFDPFSITDPLFFRDAKSGTYIPLTSKIYPEILQSKL